MPGIRLAGRSRGSNHPVRNVDLPESFVKALLLPFRPLGQGETYRALVFLLAAVPVGAATLPVLIGGWAASGILLLTPLVVIVLIAFRAAIGLLAAGDAALAAGLLETSARPRIGSGGSGFWQRGLDVLRDGTFWKQQVYLALRMTLGFGLAVGLASLWGGSLSLIGEPIGYRWNELHLRGWHVDTLARAFAVVPVGVVGLVVAAWLTLVLGRMWARIVEAMLADGSQARPPVSRRVRRLALGVHAAVAAGLSSVLLLIWALTGHGYVWPEWPILVLALALGIHGWTELVEEEPRARLGRSRGFATHLGASVALLLFFVIIWAITTRGYFWPVWPALGLALALGAHALVSWMSRGSRLARRVDVLEASRSGAVDAEEAKLRRIERDLHDGAQARLVALGMTLGLAEQRFGSDPEGAQQLVTEAREGVGQTLRELRDLARGIHPPVLSDRGLCSALASLADHSGLPIELTCRLDERLPGTIETAAYFVVAEAVTNAAKHSGADRITVDVERRDGVLHLRVADDGRGGADPEGAGLTGLRRRALAVDGTLRVTSPPGGPTVVDAELPCGS